MCMTRVGIIKHAEVKKPQAETKPKEPEKDVKKKQGVKRERFENVTYTHYSSDLGRAIVPDAATFEQYKLENVLYIKSLLNDGLIMEREPGGIDDACCMMIEESYNAEQSESGKAGGVITSESTGGYRYSKSSKAADIQTTKKKKITAEKKYKWLSLYCDILNGVR